MAHHVERGTGEIALAGALGTAGLTALTTATNARDLSRLDFPLLLGTTLTADRQRARALGWAVQGLNGVLLAAGYAAAFRTAGARPSPARGALLGALHGGLAVAGLGLLPRLHPRARAADLDLPRRRAYGRAWVPTLVAAHVIYGGLVGAALGRRGALAAEP